MVRSEGMGWTAAFVQFAPDSGRPVFAQGTGLLELLSETDNEVFDVGRGCRGRTPTAAGSIGPIDTVEALAVGPRDPDLDGAEADVKLSRHDTQRLTLPHGGHHSPALLLLAVFRS
jgi:hypothetical protein